MLSLINVTIMKVFWGEAAVITVIIATVVNAISNVLLILP